MQQAGLHQQSGQPSLLQYPTIIQSGQPPNTQHFALTPPIFGPCGPSPVSRRHEGQISHVEHYERRANADKKNICLIRSPMLIEGRPHAGTHDKRRNRAVVGRKG